MKAQPVLLFLLIFAALLVPAACAADITITSDQTDYYFGLGETANIRLPVTNTFSQDIDGTLQFTTTEQLQNSGAVLTSTKNRVYPETFPAGHSFLNISAGTSDVPKTMKIDVAFQYTDTSVVQVTLPEILVHFVEDPNSSSNQEGSSVTSTSGAASSGFGSSTVQIIQQSVSVQQQAGRDAGAGSSGSSQMGQTEASDLQNNQMAQDTSALKKQLEQEAAERDQAKNDFALNLSADPLLNQENETLTADGFTRQSVDTNPTDSSNGVFTMLYQNAAGDQVNLAGSMTDGVVPSVTEQSSAELNVTAPLAANATFSSYTNDLAVKDFQKNLTVVNQTLAGAIVNVTYFSKQGQPAYINATVENGNVTQVSLAIDQSEMNYLLIGIIAAVIIFALFCAWVIYRRLNQRKTVVKQAIAPQKPAPVPIDYRKEALRLLSEAEAAFVRQEFTDAYGLVGRAARIFLSYRHGDRKELTNAELGPVLGAAGNAERARAIMALLDRCSDVEFAKGFPEAGEFDAMVHNVREMVEKE